LSGGAAAAASGNAEILLAWRSRYSSQTTCYTAILAPSAFPNENHGNSSTDVFSGVGRSGTEYRIRIRN
jgi:hypothetical protein